MSGPIIPAEAWKPATPTLTCTEACRSWAHYIGAAMQFRVMSEPRYQPNQPAIGQTHCNSYAWDVTSAMGCEVPHWVDDSGAPCAVGQGRELSANAMLDWLRTSGAERGWREVSDVEAELQAAQGHPTLALLHEVPHGHVAVVLPARVGLRIAQAGARCLWDEPIASGFGSKKPTFFSHA